MGARKKKSAGRESGTRRGKNEKPRVDWREIDRLALESPKSDWVDRSDPAAGDPLTEDEKRGIDLLGHGSERNDAIAGVSGLPENLPDGGRREPPQVDDAGMGDGGITQSGGVAGGERGLAGTSNSGAGGPLGESAGPGEYKGTSRFDFDKPSTDTYGP